MIETQRLRRHDLLRLSPAGWQSALAHCRAPALRPWVREWASHDWPVIVRRYAPDDVSERIPVAIPLSPGAGKPGAALQVDAREILQVLPPVTVSACVAAAPVTWQASLRLLQQLADQYKSDVAVFGSLLWQTMTGLTYLNADSDLDLLWRVARPEQARELAAAIARFASQASLRIDGEFLLPDGGGVQWREWLDGADEVIVKTLRGAQSREFEGLFLAYDSMLSC